MRQNESVSSSRASDIAEESQNLRVTLKRLLELTMSLEQSAHAGIILTSQFARDLKESLSRMHDQALHLTSLCLEETPAGALALKEKEVEALYVERLRIEGESHQLILDRNAAQVALDKTRVRLGDTESRAYKAGLLVDQFYKHYVRPGLGLEDHVGEDDD